MSFQQRNCLSSCGLRTLRTSLSAPGDLPLPPEHCQVLSCRVSDSVPTLFIESKWNLNPLLSPFFLQSLWLFPLFHFVGSCFWWWWGCFSHTLSPSPSSLHKQKQLPDLLSFSLPQFTSSRRVPAEFCGSGCAGCCVNPQISFLGVQDGLVLIWLHFSHERRKKNLHAVPPSWPLLW